jgi:hyperosmotically inducible protein
MKHQLKLIVPAVIFGIAISLPAIAQDDNTPASQSMRRAGEKLEQAGSDTGSAAVDAYHGTKRAIADTTITAKVKTALHDDKEVGDRDIHVDTTAGVVTLVGQVPSRATAERAEQVAMQTEGVKSVSNQLTVNTTAGSD